MTSIGTIPLPQTLESTVFNQLKAWEMEKIYGKKFPGLFVVVDLSGGSSSRRSGAYGPPPANRLLLLLVASSLAGVGLEAGGSCGCGG